MGPSWGTKTGGPVFDPPQRDPRAGPKTGGPVFDPAKRDPRAGPKTGGPVLKFEKTVRSGPKNLPQSTCFLSEIGRFWPF